jgi:hypothetical protein
MGAKKVIKELEVLAAALSTAICKWKEQEKKRGKLVLLKMKRKDTKDLDG